MATVFDFIVLCVPATHRSGKENVHFFEAVANDRLAKIRPGPILPQPPPAFIPIRG